MDYQHHNYLNIIQWNCQSVQPKLVDLEQLLSQEKVHIAVLSETWLEPDVPFRLSGYSVVRQDRHDGYGGVAIVIHATVKYQVCQVPLDINPGIQLAYVKILNCYNIENIISIYCPSSVHTVSNDWETIFRLCSRRSIIAGDFNGHHSSWSYKTDARGIQLFEAMLDMNYITLNDSSPTRIRLVSGRLQRSSPDITIASNDVALRFTWKVTNDNLGSDHLIIKISTYITPYLSSEKRRIFTKARWGEYTNSLQDTFASISLCDDPQKSYDQFVNAINTAAEDYIPFVKVCQDPLRLQKFTPKPYWNVDISRAVAERRLALSTFRRNPTPQNLICLQIKTSTAQRLIRRAKSNAWRQFCNNISESTSPNDMWHRMRWLKGYRTPKSMISHGTATHLLHNLCPDYVTPKHPVFTSTDSSISKDISIHELNRAIKNKDTAPGEDNISFSMISHLPINAKQALLKVYNNVLAVGYTPHQWRKTMIIPIPKLSGDTQGTSKVRPIALMSCTCKIFHTILKHRLEWYLEVKGCFSENTVGFRKTRSCMDSLVHLVSQIQLGFCNNLISLACFVDIDNAYNNVNIEILLNTLNNLGVGHNICNYLWDFLKSRELNIRNQNNYLSRRTGRGLAQGDPLSPLLFNVATMHICHAIRNVFISQYADDFVLYGSYRSITEGCFNIQSALNTMNNLVEEIGLEISHKKTKICLFRKGFNRHEVIINLKESRLQLLDCVRYLGVWLDRSLKWGKHISEVIHKSSKYINILKILAGSQWGVHPRHLRTLYISIIRSRMDYGSFLYDSSVKSHLYKVEKIQNQCMRVIGGFIKSTPIHVMQNELCLQPLYLRRRYLGGKFWLKSRSLQNNNNIEVIKELSNLCLRSNKWTRNKIPLFATIHEDLNSIPIHSSNTLESFSLSTWVQDINLDDSISYSIGISGSKKSASNLYLNQKCNKLIKDNFSNHYKIYTDGSKANGVVGAAIFDPQSVTKIKFKIEANVSIMYAELFAISEALSYVQNIYHDHFVILSDSMSALQHVARCTSNFRGVPIAYTILETIQNIKAIGKTVTMQWIPSHIGLWGNEQVDWLAKEALSDGIPINVSMFYTDSLPLLKENVYNRWLEYFESCSVNKGIWYRTIQPKPYRYPWFETSKMDRSSIVTALRVRSGHIPLNKFAFLMKKVASPYCSECDIIEDAYHVIMECVRNEALRFTLFNNLECVYNVGYCNSMLSQPESDDAKSIYKLVKVVLNSRCF